MNSKQAYSKENLDDILKELGKEFRKMNGTKTVCKKLEHLGLHYFSLQRVPFYDVSANRVCVTL